MASGPEGAQVRKEVLKTWSWEAYKWNRQVAKSAKIEEPKIGGVLSQIRANRLKSHYWN
jgi:hypothetical protein